MGNRFTYNFGLGSVRDTTRGARDALTNIQTGIDNRAALAEKKRLTDIQEARQAKADERADALLTLSQNRATRDEAQYQHGLTIDKANALAASLTADVAPGKEPLSPASDTKDTTKKVINADVQDRIKALQGSLITVPDVSTDTTSKPLSKPLSMETPSMFKDVPKLDETFTVTGIPKAEDTPVVTKAKKSPYFDSSYPYAGNARRIRRFVTNAEDSDKSMSNTTPVTFADSMTTTPSSSIAEIPKPMSRKDILTNNTSIQKQIDALKSKLYDTKTIKGVHKDATYKTVPISRKTFLEGLTKDAIAANKGEPLNVYQKGAVSKRADVLFNRSQELAFKERQLKAKSADTKMDPYTKSYLTTMGKKAAGGGITGKKYSSEAFSADMYKEFGAEDQEAVATYLKNNSKKIDALNAGGRKLLLEKLKAKVEGESAFDTTNWWPAGLGGGTDVGDVLTSKG